MDFLNTILKNAQTADEVGKSVGIDGDTATKVIGRLLPALTVGLQKNVQKVGGAKALANALQSGNHQQYVDNPASVSDPSTVAEGNGILGHLLGSKDASRQLASQISGETGVDTGAIKKILPMVAAIAMGAVSKETNGGDKLEDGLGALLGGGSGGLDAVAGLAKKFL
ncbi:MAG: DUF937 domain-containing protein [Gammaproteobacteria bacterium]|nr:DUF937 domain-containing protein [Gammaproteobacteria bacterium]